MSVYARIRVMLRMRLTYEVVSCRFSSAVQERTKVAVDVYRSVGTMKILKNSLLLLLLMVTLRINQAIPAIKSGINDCPDGYYSSSKGCNTCSPCLDNEIVIKPCTNSSNSICFTCNVNSPTNQQYVARVSSSLGHQCKNCTHCKELHREEIVGCSVVRDSVCGGCMKGYFLGVDTDAQVKCLACSLCPPDDETVAKWRECQESGLKPDMWCSPDLHATTIRSYSQYSTHPVANVNQVGSYSNAQLWTLVVLLSLLSVVTSLIVTLCFIVVIFVTHFKEVSHYKTVTA